jgi:hypothetical protein
MLFMQLLPEVSRPGLRHLLLGWACLLPKAIKFDLTFAPPSALVERCIIIIIHLCAVVDGFISERERAFLVAANGATLIAVPRCGRPIPRFCLFDRCLAPLL